MTPPALLQSALKLPPAERILLVEQIWDSLTNNDQAALPDLTPAQKKELDRRLARLKRTGPLGSPWSEVKARVKARRP